MKYIERRIENARENEKELNTVEEELYLLKRTLGQYHTKVRNTYYQHGEECELEAQIVENRIRTAAEYINKAYSLISDAQQEISAAERDSKKLYQLSRFLSPADILAQAAINVAKKEDAEKFSSAIAEQQQDLAELKGTE